MSLCPRKSCQEGGESQLSTLLGLKGKWPASIWVVSKGFLDEGEMDLVGERGSEGRSEGICFPSLESQRKHQPRK